MHWNEFLSVAYPNDLKREDIEKRTLIFRLHRWSGLYLGYFLFHLGISANVVGIGRIFIALSALYLLSFAKQGNNFLTLIGIFLLYGQHILDQVDGVIARAAGTVNPLGARLDGIGNAFSRHGIVILVASFTGSISLLILASLISYGCVALRDLFLIDGLAYDTEFKGFAIFFRVVFSIQAMLFIWPVALFLNGLFKWTSIEIFSCISVAFYATMTVWWFALSFKWFYKNVK